MVLLERLYRRLPKPNSGDGHTASLTTSNIRDDVRDRFIDLLLADGGTYDDRLDFYEISFNQAMACDILDARRKHWSIENRGVELGSDEEEISARVEAAAGQYDPFDPHELDKKDYRRRLEDAIDTLPKLQQQIVEMWRQDIPIDSSDSSVTTISGALGKSEKTIRTHRDKAFASLRRRLERKENMR
ncbi:RNA polymerase sigma factor [Cupriavidus basilensis]